MDFCLLNRIRLRLPPSDAIKRLRLELCKLLILGGSNYDVQLDQLAFKIVGRAHANSGVGTWEAAGMLGRRGGCWDAPIDSIYAIAQHDPCQEFAADSNSRV